MKINIAYILPKLSKKAPVEYVYSLVLELNSYFNIDIYYFDKVVEIEFPCSTRQINIFETIDFNKYDIVHLYFV